MSGIKKVIWLFDTLEKLKEFPETVKDSVGYTLYKIQEGLVPKNVKHLVGLKPTAMEIITEFDKNAYRIIYTTKINDVIFVLHCFQKKSKKGAKTPKQEIDLIKQRLKDAMKFF